MTARQKTLAIVLLYCVMLGGVPGTKADLVSLRTHAQCAMCRIEYMCELPLKPSLGKGSGT